jgi:hypothetical protein
LPAHATQGDSMGILSFVGIFQRASVQVLSNRLFNDPAGYRDKVVILA